MSTVGKALMLLDELSTFPDDASLADIAQKCALDKATARRFLVELEKLGIVERVAASKKYRLGPATVRLARIREFRVPFLKIATPVADHLAEAVGETVHVSVLSNRVLSIVHVIDSIWSHRVVVEVGEKLPLHATASGIAVLSAGPPSFLEETLSSNLVAFTDHTVTGRDQMRLSVEEAVKNGFSLSLQGLDEGVASVAAPIGRNEQLAGAVSIAVPLARWKPSDARRLGSLVRAAATEITNSLSGTRSARAESTETPTCTENGSRSITK